VRPEGPEGIRLMVVDYLFGNLRCGAVLGRGMALLAACTTQSVH